MRVADHTMPEKKGRNGVQQQPHTVQYPCFILRCCVLPDLQLMTEGTEPPRTPQSAV